MQRGTKTFLGYAIAIGAGLGLAWCAVVGLAFASVYGMGCIGTSGREACGEMAAFLAITPIACLLMWLLYRVGRGMVRSSRA
ncbi:hypothetical protein [Ramlibacter sp.]|uniref:hypothetical protein n=1 Tax=Ramlibacter sp. TaxID=1917967 RepID=UPI003D0D57D8